jgi:hypothetical protein
MHAQFFALTFGAESEVNGLGFPIDIPRAGRADLAQFFEARGFTRGAEVGVEQGVFSEILLYANVNLRQLYLVDAWCRYREYRDHVSQAKLDDFYETTKSRLSKYDDRVTYVRRFSMDAVRDFKHSDLDFVYIDSNHSFDYVMPDIIEWSKLVRSGGIVAGHDYIKRAGVHVIEAVEAYTNAHNIWPWYTLGGDTAKGEPPSFFWVKP